MNPEFSKGWCSVCTKKSSPGPGGQDPPEKGDGYGWDGGTVFVLYLLDWTPEPTMVAKVRAYHGGQGNSSLLWLAMQETTKQRQALSRTLSLFQVKLAPTLLSAPLVSSYLLASSGFFSPFPLYSYLHSPRNYPLCAETPLPHF